MKLNSKEALELLNEASKMNNTGYIKHSMLVGEAASRIAKALNLDEDYAKALGYIHDIGKRYGSPYYTHPTKGYDYLKSIGVDEEMASISLTHSYLNNDINCTGGEVVEVDNFDNRKEYIKNHKYTIYDKIICFCDLMCRKDFMIVEERLIDLMLRRGINKNTIYHLEEVYKLKKEIDTMLGYNVYKLFPEIKDRIFN